MMRTVKKPYLKNRRLILGNEKKTYVKSGRLTLGNRKPQKGRFLPIAAALVPLAPLAINGLVKLFGGGKKQCPRKVVTKRPRQRPRISF